MEALENRETLPVIGGSLDVAVQRYGSLGGNVLADEHLKSSDDRSLTNRNREGNFSLHSSRSLSRSLRSANYLMCAPAISESQLLSYSGVVIPPTIERRIMAPSHFDLELSVRSTSVPFYSWMASSPFPSGG